MTATADQIQQKVIDLAAESFQAFCDDISGMFGIAMQSEQIQSEVMTVKQLKEEFKKLIAVNFVKTEGILEGHFQLIFDQVGLFTTSGVIVMLPDNKIREKIKLGVVEDTEYINDAIKECGNLLVGSWDKVFRESLEDHGHLLQTGTFVGKPWDQPYESIGLENDEEILFVSHEMTIESYPTFKCGVIYPMSLFRQADSEQDDSPPLPEQDDNSSEKTETADKGDNKTAEEPAPKKENKKPQAGTRKDTEDKKASKESKKSEESEKNDTAGSEQNKTGKQAQHRDQTAEKKAEQTKAPEKQSSEQKETSKPGPVSQSIREMKESVQPGSQALSSALAKLQADQIMQKELLWAAPDEDVESVLKKMQQEDTDYVLVGRNEQLEGILSRSDVNAALSIYLRPIFSNWRRPLDEATLRIRIKWIMSRPVYTIKPDAPIEMIITKMGRFGGKCLPVADSQGKIQGIVTAFDILKALVNAEQDGGLVGKAPTGSMTLGLSG